MGKGVGIELAEVTRTGNAHRVWRHVASKSRQNLVDRRAFFGKRLVEEFLQLCGRCFRESRDAKPVSTNSLTSRGTALSE